MAQHASALKRHRQSEKRRIRNKGLKTHLRHMVRAVHEAIEKKDGTAATRTLSVATRALDKAVTKGVVHRNTAARKISRLTRAVHGLQG